MRIILKNADFSEKNINPTFSVTLNLTGVVTDSDITSVKQGSSYSATFLVGSGYAYSSTVITVGGTILTDCYSLSPDNDVIEVNIPASELTGDVVIIIVAEEAASGYTATFQATSMYTDWGYYSVDGGSTWNQVTSSKVSFENVTEVQVKITSIEVGYVVYWGADNDSLINTSDSTTTVTLTKDTTFEYVCYD